MEQEVKNEYVIEYEQTVIKRVKVVATSEEDAEQAFNLGGYDGDAEIAEVVSDNVLNVTLIAEDVVMKEDV